MNKWFFCLVGSFLMLGIFSWGFVDPGLYSFAGDLFLSIQKPLSFLAYQTPILASLIFSFLLISLIVSYLKIFASSHIQSFGKNIRLVLIFLSLIGAVSFPALSYDVFNYMTTAKVIFTHRENPYLVMPVEIANEPNLAFTRASNKYALYGPVWLILSALPHYLGGGNIWQTIIAFKVFNVIGYLSFVFLLFKVTGSVKNVLFFATNPLILIEVLLAGHNDIFMMIPAILGLFLWRKQGLGNKILGSILFISSWFVKIATVVLTPLLLMRNVSRDRMLVFAYWLLFFVFFIFAPIREELYPWYAVWCITIASFLDLKKHATLIAFTILLSCALEFRHIPYMATLSYAGWGVAFRFFVSYVPVTLFLCYSMWNNRRAIERLIHIWKNRLIRS